MKSLSRPLNYNENKVKNQDASLLSATNFLEEKEDLNFYDKKNRLEQLMKLNSRTEKKVVHISLNFSPNDRVDQAELAQIAEEYMGKLGFGEQPYLVYQHYDAGHLHMHIVSTLIRPDGMRIGTHKLESTKSLQICRELELKYGLVKAEKKAKDQEQSILTHNPLKLEYGKQETKRGIANVLDAVLTKYKYTSLEELNAVLKLYNVMADRGPKDGVVYKAGGLYYRILDDNGNIKGRPIKASSIYSGPTLKFLEERFAENKITRIPLKQRIKTAIDWQLRANPSITLPELIEQLKDDKINVLLRQNEHKLIYGITYVDLKNKAVFNGSDLGKQYAANGILERTGKQSLTVLQIAAAISPVKFQAETEYAKRPNQDKHHQPSLSEAPKPSSKAVYPGEYLPFELKNNKKRKKKKLLR